MYPMSMSAAHQLVSDRRTGHEAAASRRRLRRLFSRDQTLDAPSPRPTLVPLAGGADRTVARAERTVA